MLIEEGIYSYLSTYAGLTALIGTRIYPLENPQNVTLPAVCYQLISTPQAQGYTHAGPTGLLIPRFQFDCYAGTSLACRQVAAQVRAAMDGYVGLMGTVVVAVAQVVSDRAAYEDEPRRFRAGVDVQIQYYL